MRILLAFLASVLIVSTTFAESKCDLDGGGLRPYTSVQINKVPLLFKDRF